MLTRVVVYCVVVAVGFVAAMGCAPKDYHDIERSAFAPEGSPKDVSGRPAPPAIVANAAEAPAAGA